MLRSGVAGGALILKTRHMTKKIITSALTIILVLSTGAAVATPADAQVQTQGVPPGYGYYHYPRPIPPVYPLPVPIDEGTKFYTEAVALNRLAALQSAFRIHLSNALDTTYVSNLRVLNYPYDARQPRPLSAEELPYLSTFLY